MQRTVNNSERQTSIEILKLFAMFIIVLSHVVQSLSLNEQWGNFMFRDILIDLSCASTDPARVFLSSMRYCGALGNTIFFLCSAWFFLDKKATSKIKIFHMMADVWIISIGTLILSVIFCREMLSVGILIKLIFPVLYANNWYVTCYILFCLVHPFLNLIIKETDQRSLLRIAAFMMVAYIGLNFINSSFLYGNTLITWIAIYFVLGYMKLYAKGVLNSNKISFLFLLIGVIGNSVLILATNFLGMKVSIFYDKLLHWHTNSNPFLIMIAFSLLNFARKGAFKNRFINQISKLTLLIYLVHENLFLCNYLRPLTWSRIIDKFGSTHLILWCGILGGGVFYCFNHNKLCLFENSTEDCKTYI